MLKIIVQPDFTFLIWEMLWGYLIAGLIAGIGIWYLIFYFQYEKREIVSELRKNLKIANEQLSYLQEEMEELTAQNDLFREKTTELLEKNDELSDVVAELGKYYVHIKKASEKSAELSKLLHEPDEEIEGKLWNLSEIAKQSIKNSFF